MFRNLYKQNVRSENLQEERRRKLLEEQRCRRLQLQDSLRELNFDQYKKHRRGKPFFKEIYGYQHSLQLSEWLRERPDDLSDWVLVPCPKGQRCTIIACGGRTEMYNKLGRYRMKFHSMLPGDALVYKNTSLLDCIYVQNEDTFYVLDALIFGNQELVDCEAQFRFFWLRSKFEENEGLLSIGPGNEKPFRLLERYDLNNMEHITTALQRFPFWPNNRPELDGFLFYHKEGSYTNGETPLVGWLFPFMVHDILGLVVNSSYKPPENYSNPLCYMDAFDAQLVRKKHLNRRAETTNINENDMNTSSLALLLEKERQLEMNEQDSM